MGLSLRNMWVPWVCLSSCLVMEVSASFPGGRFKRQIMFPAERSLGLQSGAFNSPLAAGPVQYPTQLYGNPGLSNYAVGYPIGGATGQLLPSSFAGPSNFQPALLPQQQSQYFPQPQQQLYAPQQPQQNFQQQYVPQQQQQQQQQPRTEFQQRGLPVQQPLLQQSPQNYPVHNDQPATGFGASNGGFTSGSSVQNGGYQPAQVQYPPSSNPIPSLSGPYPSNSVGYAQQVPSYANSVQTQTRVQDERPALVHAYQNVIANQMQSPPFVSATEAPSFHIPQQSAQDVRTVPATTVTPYPSVNRDTKMVSNDEANVNTVQQPTFPEKIVYQPEHDILPYPKSDQFLVLSTPIPQTPSEVEWQKAKGALPSFVTVGTTVVATTTSTTLPTTQQVTGLTTTPDTTTTANATQLSTTLPITNATTTNPYFDSWFSKTESPEVVGRTRLLGVIKLPSATTNFPVNETELATAKGVQTTSVFPADDLKRQLPPPKNETLAFTKPS
ncbi:hypothetical protein RvY_17285 [Ramazzottius varieornatus]|uniref:Uncharacterized protein n=1 Tax=Ramazzottius varieornatus TaxID=947166 RepID=A0A1D1W1L2_RAMVA|nr:hypothetical protein RvY_17285 [Ramazzottius varieornatus]